MEQESLEAQYRKSNELYAAQTGYNARVADKAIRDEQRKLGEIHAEGAFNAQEQRLKLLQAESVRTEWCLSRQNTPIYNG